MLDKLTNNDVHHKCFVTCIIEIVLSFLGFVIAASALGLQHSFNAAFITGTALADLNIGHINIASCAVAFFVLAIFTSGAGIHGYRTRNHWGYLTHFVLSVFFVLCFFALFIHTLVQFSSLNQFEETSAPTNSTPSAAADDSPSALPVSLAEADTDAEKLVTRLGFPCAIYFFHIILYILSGRWSFKAWSDCGSVARELVPEPNATQLE
jgi:hypothetical protein